MKRIGGENLIENNPYIIEKEDKKQIEDFKNEILKEPAYIAVNKKLKKEQEERDK